VTIHVGDDRAVAIDAATKEIREVFVGNVKRAQQRKALRRCQAYAEQPAIEATVASLDTVARGPIATLHGAHLGS
jgi:hypothetical protein